MTENFCIIGYDIRQAPRVPPPEWSVWTDAGITVERIKFNLTVDLAVWERVNPRPILGRTEEEKLLPDYMVPDFLSWTHLIKPFAITPQVLDRIHKLGYVPILLACDPARISTALKTIKWNVSTLQCEKRLEKDDLEPFVEIGADIVYVTGLSSVLGAEGMPVDWRKKYVEHLNTYHLFDTFSVATDAASEINEMYQAQIAKGEEGEMLAVKVYVYKESMNSLRNYGCG